MSTIIVSISVIKTKYAQNSDQTMLELLLASKIALLPKEGK